MGYLKGAKLDPWARDRSPSKYVDEVTIRITIPIELRVRMSTLRVSPREVALKAFRAEVKAREERAQLKRLQELDPRVTLQDLREKGTRVRRFLERLGPI